MLRDREVELPAAALSAPELEESEDRLPDALLASVPTMVAAELMPLCGSDTPLSSPARRLSP